MTRRLRAPIFKRKRSDGVTAHAKVSVQNPEDAEFLKKKSQFRDDLFYCRTGFCQKALSEFPEWSNMDTDAQGEKALHVVMKSSHGCVDMVELLLAHGANIEAKTSNDFTPLLMGVTSGASLALCQSLIQHGANIWCKEKDNTRHLSSLHWAAMKPRNDLVQLLCEMGGTELIENRSVQGARPLHKACERFRISSMEILLQAGANPSAPNDLNQTPLSIIRGLPNDVNSTRASHELLLLSYGADPRDADPAHQNFTMEMAASARGDANRLFALRHHRMTEGSDFSSYEMEAALMAARKHQKIETVKILESWLAAQSIDAILSSTQAQRRSAP